MASISRPRAKRALALTMLLLFVAMILPGVNSAHATSTEPLPSTKPMMLPVPAGYVHRPLLEFFTGLSCPSCMGGPDQDIEKLIAEDGGKGENFHAVVFHELNGGGVDDLATDETMERMRHYQPGVSGTPDAEFDGGYIELGGMTSPGGSVDYANAKSAVDTCQKRYEQSINPLHPLQSIMTKFKFVNLKVKEVFNGNSIGVVVEVEYLGTNIPALREVLNAEVYVFIVEDNVPAYSMVTKKVEINNNVFRGYAIKGQKITLNRGENTTLSGEWTIPKEAKVPVKPQNVYAIAAVFDLDDTSSQNGNSGNKATVPRCIQSASSKTTAMDSGNTPPVITGISANEKGDKIEVSANIQDDDGLLSAYMVYSTDKSGLNWSSVPMKMLGEELCDESGVCYAYGSGMAQGEFKPPKDWGGQYLIVATDAQGLRATSRVMNYTGGAIASRTVGNEFGGLSGLDGNVALILAVGIVVSILGLYAGLRQRDVKRGLAKMDAKAKYAIVGAVVAIVIVLLAYVFVFSGAFKGTTKAPDFTVEDTQGNKIRLSDYRGSVVLLDIMSTTCSGCEEAMNTLLKLYPEYKDNVVFLSISVDTYTDTKDVLENYKHDKGAEWTFARDINGEVLTEYNANKIPRIYVVDASGNIVYAKEGPPPEDELKNALDRAVSGTASPISITTTTGTVGLIAVSILAGAGMFFSPCAFPLLPGYISYYLSRTHKKGGAGEGLKAGTVASLGIITVFIVLGLLVAILGEAISQYFIYLEPIVGIALIILGIVLFMDIPVPIHYLTEPIKRAFSRISPKKVADEGEGGNVGGHTGLFAYGVGYAAGAASCTAPLLIGLVALGLQAGGFVGAMIMFTIFALSMAALMIIFTVMAAVGGQAVFMKYTRAMRYIEKGSAVVLIIVGIYFVYYYYSVVTGL